MYQLTGDGCDNPPLIYNGGPVQHDPRVYLVFWGSKWSQTDPIVTTIETMFNSLAGSSYGNILSQYTDKMGAPDNYVHNDSYLGAAPDFDTGTSIPANLTLANLNEESSIALRLNGWIDDSNTQVMIFPQQGSTYDPDSINPANECGEHDQAAISSALPTPYVFSLIMYASDFGCDYGGGNNANNMASAASHEFAESATDPDIGYAGAPYGNGWLTSDGYEVGDVCNFVSFTYSPANGTAPSYVQELWSNADYYQNNQTASAGCVEAVGQEYASPDELFPFHGVHTVQGVIQQKYVSLGQTASVIGAPVSEQMPLGPDGGRVSYFAGNGNLACQYDGPSKSSGAIYFSPATGAWEVHSCLFDDYLLNSESNGPLGFPVSDVQPIPGVADGDVSYFRGNGNLVCQYYGPSAESGAIYWSPATGAHEVHSCLFGDYLAEQGPGGPLGFPVDDTKVIPGGLVSYFTGNDGCGTPGPEKNDGAIYWSSGTEANAIYGCIYAFYETGTADNGQSIANVLGFPLSNELGVTSRYGTSGRVNYFTGNYGCTSPNSPDGSDGAIYWTGNAAYEVHGCIYAAYWNSGGPSSALGFPTSNEYINSAGNYESDFENGTIVWVNGAPQITIACPKCVP